MGIYKGTHMWSKIECQIKASLNRRKFKVRQILNTLNYNMFTVRPLYCH